MRMKAVSTRSSDSLCNNELQTSVAAWNQCGTLLATHTGAMLSLFSTFWSKRAIPNKLFFRLHVRPRSLLGKIYGLGLKRP